MATLHIAICDDINEVCSQIERYVIDVCKKVNVKHDVSIYYNGQSLKNSLIQGKCFELIFLDIEMPLLDGISTAFEIRNTLDNVHTQICYVSGKTEYAMRLFRSNPIDFIVKPVKYENIELVIIKLLKLLEMWFYTFQYKIGREVNSIEVKNIIYLESDKRKIKLISTAESNDDIVFYGNINDIYEEQLKRHSFLPIHGSILANYHNVKSIKYESLTMINDVVLTISQPKRKDIRKQISKLEQKGFACDD